MELRLTTKRALEYEERTGNDIVTKLQEIGQSGAVKVKDVVDIFVALGEGYTVELFDAWEGTFIEKATKVFDAVKKFISGQNEKE